MCMVAESFGSRHIGPQTFGPRTFWYLVRGLTNLPGTKYVQYAYCVHCSVTSNWHRTLDCLMLLASYGTALNAKLPRCVKSVHQTTIHLKKVQHIQHLQFIACIGLWTRHIALQWTFCAKLLRCPKLCTHNTCCISL